MDTGYFDKYPGLTELFEQMKAKRPYEILDSLKSRDGKYAEIVKMRAEQSMVVREKLGGDILDFEKYSDLIYAQEVCEQEEIYERAFMDALEALRELRII